MHGDATEILVEQPTGPFKPRDFGKNGKIDPDDPKDRKMLRRTNFPVAKLKIVLLRDPRPVLQSTVLPTMIQAVLAVKCCTIGDPAERNNNLSVPLLAVNGIQALLKSQLPTLGGLTTAEGFVLVYSILMMTPLLIPEEEPDEEGETSRTRINKWLQQSTQMEVDIWLLVMALMLLVPLLYVIF